MKKLLIVFLSLVMLLSVTSGMNITVSAYTTHSQSEAIAWVNSKVGQYLDYDGLPVGDVYQCVDVTKYYYAYLGVAVPTGSAKYYVNGGNYCPSGWSYQTSPQPGDIAVWTGGDNGHVAIVTEISGSQMICVEQNYASKKYCSANPHNIDAQKYIRPDFAGGSINPIIHDNKNYVTVGESITFWYSGLTECSKAEFYFEKGGTLYYTKDSTASREFSTYFENEGIYHVYCGGYYNGQWYYSDRITVYVFNPKLTSDKTIVTTNEEITFNYSGLTNCENVTICFEKNGKVYWTVDSTKTRTHKNSFSNPGEYYVYAKGTINDYSTISNKIRIRVKCDKHTWNSVVTTKKATCTTTGTKLYTCTVCGETKTETIKAKGHTSVIDKAVPATCTTAGKTEGSHCSVCGEIITAQTTIPAPGHTIVIDKAIAPTFEKSGKTEGKHCSTCGEVVVAQKTVAKLVPSATTLSSVTSKSKGFTVKWKKQTKNTTGYQIQYSISSSFKSGNKTVTISKNGKTSKTISKLKAKKKYYVRIRTYKSINGKKYYSAWSAKKSVTTKK